MNPSVGEARVRRTDALEALTGVAEEQAGLLTRAQAEQLGVSP
jgi:hypothetical protein